MIGAAESVTPLFGQGTASRVIQAQRETIERLERQLKLVSPEQYMVQQARNKLDALQQAYERIAALEHANRLLVLARNAGQELVWAVRAHNARHTKFTAEMVGADVVHALQRRLDEFALAYDKTLKETR